MRNKKRRMLQRLREMNASAKAAPKAKVPVKKAAPVREKPAVKKPAAKEVKAKEE